jgi:hypothetical protein
MRAFILKFSLNRNVCRTRLILQILCYFLVGGYTVLFCNAFNTIHLLVRPAVALQMHNSSIKWNDLEVWLSFMRIKKMQK